MHGIWSLGQRPAFLIAFVYEYESVKIKSDILRVLTDFCVYRRKRRDSQEDVHKMDQCAAGKGELSARGVSGGGGGRGRGRGQLTQQTNCQQFTRTQ